MTTRRWSSWVRVRDVALVVGCLLLTWQNIGNEAVTPGPRMLAFAAMLPGILVLPWRRSWALVGLVVALVPDLAYWFAYGAPENVGLLLPLTVLLYAVGRWEPNRRRALIAILVMIPLLGLHEWLDPSNTSFRLLLTALPYDAVAPAAWLLGSLVRVREEQALSRAERIAGDERTRIARELHDIVAHGIGVMVVQAEGAAEVVGQDPDRARRAMERVAETGRESLVELRRALGMLRDSGPAAHEPLPGLGRLDELLGRARESGLLVASETIGAPAQLSPGIDLALYRVVQEALTNTLRHAGASRATVRVEHVRDRVRVEVVDDGRAAGPGVVGAIGATGSTGGGLLGIRERIGMLGGDVELGPLPAGGFRVAVSVPVLVTEPSP